MTRNRQNMFGKIGNSLSGMREAGKAVSDPEHVCSTPPYETGKCAGYQKSAKSMYFTKNYHQIVKMRLRISILSNRFLSKYKSDAVPEFTNISIFRQTATIGRRKGGKNLQLSGKRPRPEGAAASLSSRPEGGARSGEICYIIMEKISPLRSRRLGKRLRPR